MPRMPDNEAGGDFRNRKIHIAWSLSLMALILSALVTSGAYRFYPKRGGGKGAKVGGKDGNTINSNKNKTTAKGGGGAVKGGPSKSGAKGKSGTSTQSAMSGIDGRRFKRGSGSSLGGGSSFSSGGGGNVPRPGITMPVVRLRLRGLRTPLNRRLPPSRPAMSAISGARFRRGLTTASTNSAPNKGKATP